MSEEKKNEILEAMAIIEEILCEEGIGIHDMGVGVSWEAVRKWLFILIETCPECGADVDQHYMSCKNPDCDYTA